jgi:uroporphyrin-III C-methyltransferase
MSTTTVEQLSFSAPVGGASLLLSFRLERKTIVIIGGGALAAARAFAALEADAKVVVLCAGGVEAACEELRWRATHEQLSVVDLSALPGSSADDLGVVLAKYLPTIGPISLLCVTDTMLGVSSGRRSRASAETISRLCRSRGIPANITDMPDLCDFSFTSTHRFADTTTGKPSSLQIGVTTNGQGCRIAARVRREIVAQLPKEVGTATGNISRLRERVKEAERSESLLSTDGPTEEENEDNGVLTPNRPVRQHHAGDIETAAERARRQMKWVAQVSEYWSFGQLARMSDNDMRGVLSGGTDGLLGDVLGIGADRSPHTRPALHSAGDSELASIHSLGLPAPPKSVKKGKIFLVGSGPGHPSLLTIATHAALTKYADLVLSDKLVPAAVLEIIPPHVEVRIARKFPGNAEGAQQEMMDAAVEAASRGLNVVRVRLRWYILYYPVEG